MAKTPKSPVQAAVSTAKSKTSDTPAGSNVVVVKTGIGSAPVEVTPSLRKKRVDRPCRH